jgi:antitoxin HigA-1
MTDRLPNIHPGEILREEFLQPLGMTGNDLADALRMPGGIIGQVLRGHHAITAKIALRLSRYFGCSPEFFMNLQTDYDLEEARKTEAEALERIQPRGSEAETP